jgi:hypothetical protein
MDRMGVTNPVIKRPFERAFYDIHVHFAPHGCSFFELRSRDPCGKLFNWKKGITFVVKDGG